MSTYVTRASAALRRELPGVAPGLLRKYTLLALVRGEETTLEDVHNAWAVWRAECQPVDPDVRPFRTLPDDARERGRPTVEAIRRVARRLRKQDGD